MPEKITLAEARERYRMAREIDRQSFRVHWKQVCLESFLALIANSFVGYAAGLLVSTYSIVEVLKVLPH
jgi:hypothetical protein